MQEDSKKESKLGKESAENKEALHTNSNSPSLVMKEQSEKESKSGRRECARRFKKGIQIWKRELWK